MKLSSIEYYLDWPASIKVKNLRGSVGASFESPTYSFGCKDVRICF